MAETPLAVEAGSGRHRVWGTATLLSGAVCLQLFGGDAPHIGAVAVAQATRSRTRRASWRASTSVLSLPGHREDELVRPCAELLATALRRTAVVVAGIHVDDATAADIAALVRNARRAVRAVVTQARGARRASDAARARGGASRAPRRQIGNR